MPYITDDMRALIGVPGELQTAPYPLGPDTLRRFVQAVGEQDPMHWDPQAARERGHETLVSPPLHPLHLFVRAPGTPDPFERFREEADWDGMGGTINRGLPKLKLPFKRLLNGGYACEFYRLARLGDTISRQSRYIEITEREGSSGPMVITKIETLYTNQDGQKLVRIVHTEIAR
jgi:acyl dehydratase